MPTHVAAKSQTVRMSGSTKFRLDPISAAVLALVFAVSGARAQFQLDYREVLAETERNWQAQALHAERQRLEAIQAERSARAHSRMAADGLLSGLSNAGRTNSPDWQMAHPNIPDPSAGFYVNYGYTAVPPPLAPRYPSMLDLLIWQDVAPDDEPLESLFETYISGPIVQTKCVLCHVAGGVSGQTRLVFSPSTVDNNVNLNREAFRTFVSTVDDGAELILNKASGAVIHGGGLQVAAGSADFMNLERFVRALENGASTDPADPVDPVDPMDPTDPVDPADPMDETVNALFEGVTMTSPARTLRRAAILFAGRLPTQPELDAVAGGEEASLRAAIRGLMSGEGFHDFLVRSSNDRLLTDRQIEQEVFDLDSIELVALNRKHWQMAHAAESRGNGWHWGDEEFRTWVYALRHGFARAPLELIAYVVENDRPYTEILTADYVMANPMAAEAYGATTQFENVNDPFEFKPSEIVSYYRNDFSKVVAYHSSLGNVVLQAGDLLTDYPHAGVLNTGAFLSRYPTTATNRNRLRSRWTYYHFLGEDIQKTTLRTTDATALLDTNNPTLNNMECAQCHNLLDPVAGTFQNYGDEGLYRDQFGGNDSLDGQYKEGFQRSERLTVNSRSWEERDTVSVTRRLLAGRQVIALETRSPHNIHVDHLTVRDSSGNVVSRKELEEFTGHECGNAYAGYTFELIHCPLEVPIEISSDGEYEIETAAYVGYERDGAQGQPATLGMVFYHVVYREGDTWFRDMRSPGFGDLVAPNPDNSLQWLAQQIAADNRFAEATVKFWWPAIMGAGVLEAPEDSAAPNYEARSMAATAQAAEISRLAAAFRRGIAGGTPYNGRHLLAEMALSPWFRADSVAEVDEQRMAALRDAGVARLLTPEELNRKTEVLAGYVWGRQFYRSTNPDRGTPRSALQGHGYELLFGGIDSDGITTRATDMTPVMAAVAQSHAAEVSCPIVRREFYFWEDSERMLFNGVGRYDSPVSETFREFEVTADTYETRETFTLELPLTAGNKTVRFTFPNDFWHQELGDRNLRIDRLTVLDSSGRTVANIELEQFGSGPCRGPDGSFDASYSSSRCNNSSLSVPLEIAQDGVYQLGGSGPSRQGRGRKRPYDNSG